MVFFSFMMLNKTIPGRYSFLLFHNLSPVTLCPSLFYPLRTIETPRAVVKKLRFAPGKGNSKLFVLYNTQLDIRDTLSVSGCGMWGGVIVGS